MKPFVLAGYERDLGRALIDSGCSVVLGSHQHILKGIEIYKGAPILYGMGNFVFDLHLDTLTGNPERLRYLEATYGGHLPRLDEDSPRGVRFAPEAETTIICHIHLSRHELESVSIIPCIMNEDGDPTPAKVGDDTWLGVCSYIERASIEIESPISIHTTPAGDCCGAAIQ